MDPASPFHRHVARVLDERLVRDPGALPSPTPRGRPRLLTIGMATYDDYDGVYFSVQAIRLYHPEVTERTEILVVDNHPRGPGAGPLKALERQVAGYRYVPYERTRGTAVRDVVFREANAEFVLCMDSHVLFPPGTLARLLDLLAAGPGSRDLWQGPLMGDDQRIIGTHFEPVWRAGLYGTWAADPRGLDPDAPPFDIPMQGLGMFACRRAAWPGLNPRLHGFGAEEGYLHEKVRRGGGRTLCVPFLRWMHRFARPHGPRYEVSVEDRVRNYLLVHDELGLDPTAAIEHLEGHFGASRVRPLVDATRRELRGALHHFEAIYRLGLDRTAAAAGPPDAGPGLARRLRRFPALETPHDPRVGRTLSHRAIVAEARWLGLANVLVVEDDALLSPATEDALARDVAALSARPWGVVQLAAPGRAPAAVAYHERVYGQILAELPATPTAMVRWLRDCGGLEEFYRSRLAS